MKKFKIRTFVTLLAALAVPFLSFAYVAPAHTNVAKAEISTETDEVGNNEEVVEEEKEITLDSFLEALKPYADKAGVGSEFNKAVEAIKTAASKKQVTIATLSSIASLAGIVVFVIWKNGKDKTLLRSVVKIAEQLENQVKGTNALIDEANKQGKINTKAEAEARQLKKAVANLAKMFALFTERVNIGESTKEEIRQEALKAQKTVNAEVEV